VQPNYYAQQQPPQFLALPHRFARRFVAGVIVTGLTLIFSTTMIYLLTLLLRRHSTALYVVLSTLPALGVVAVGVTLLMATRCLHGDYLVIARARSTRNTLLVCTLTTAALALIAMVVPIFSGGAEVANFFGPAVYLFDAGLGLAFGHFWVRPSIETLRKFSDRPAW
jgi:hypothetical protein